MEYRVRRNSRMADADGRDPGDRFGSLSSQFVLRGLVAAEIAHAVGEAVASEIGDGWNCRQALARFCAFEANRDRGERRGG